MPSGEPVERVSAAVAAWRFLAGPPLRARDVAREQITPVEGLPALSLDALTSVVYGPEAIIAVLAVAGATALHLVLPITIAIVVLLAILVFSYRQVIDAYPGGGGAYAVSRANLGRGASLVAGAALVVDYTLTVAVSIAAGVAALTSAFPSLSSATVPICLGILAVVTALNLRAWGRGPGVPAAHDAVHLRPAGHRRDRPDSPAGAARRPARPVAAARQGGFLSCAPRWPSLPERARTPTGPAPPPSTSHPQPASFTMSMAEAVRYTRSGENTISHTASRNSTGQDN
jgi:hypothetical protein